MNTFTAKKMKLLRRVSATKFIDIAKFQISEVMSSNAELLLRFWQHLSDSLWVYRRHQRVRRSDATSQAYQHSWKRMTEKDKLLTLLNNLHRYQFIPMKQCCTLLTTIPAFHGFNDVGPLTQWESPASFKTSTDRNNDRYSASSPST